jgi:transposase
VIQTTPANWRDDKPALELIRRIPALPNARGLILHRPGCILGDSAYGTCQIMLPLMLDGVVPMLAKAGHRDHGSGLGRWRYPVERTFTWFGHYRRIRCCYERLPEHFQAFNVLAAAQICLHRLQKVISRF